MPCDLSFCLRYDVDKSAVIPKLPLQTNFVNILGVQLQSAVVANGVQLLLQTLTIIKYVTTQTASMKNSTKINTELHLITHRSHNQDALIVTVGTIILIKQFLGMVRSYFHIMISNSSSESMIRCSSRKVKSAKQFNQVIGNNTNNIYENYQTVRWNWLNPSKNLIFSIF